METIKARSYCPRHCERSEAIQCAKEVWIASLRNDEVYE
jgi:hypothetical protein